MSGVHPPPPKEAQANSIKLHPSKMIEDPFPRGSERGEME